MSKSGTIIVKLSDVSAFAPKLTVRVTALKDKPNTYLLTIVHPNKTEAVLDAKGQIIKNKRTGRIKKVGAIIHSEEIINENSDQMAAFLEVKAIGDKMLAEGKFSHIETKYEEILHIPAARKGKMKLKTKGALAKGLDEDYSDGSENEEDVELLDDNDEDIVDSEIEDVDILDEEVFEEVEEEEVRPPKSIKPLKSKKKSAKVMKTTMKVEKAKPKTIKNKAKNNKKTKLKSKTKKPMMKKNKNNRKR